MSAPHLQPLPGFRDLPPAQFSLRAYLFGVWRSVATRYGFTEWEGPTLEPTELYLKKSGGELPGQLFRFTDQGKRDVSLRPELTASLGRIVTECYQDYNKPMKWFEIGPCFRYEKPQKGRMREFVQFNADILGEAGPGADAELLALVIDCMRSLGLSAEDFTVRISDRQVWSAYAQNRGIAPDRTGDFLAIIDKLDRNDPNVTKKKLEEFGISLDELQEFIQNPPHGISPRYDTVWADLSARGLAEYVQLDLAVVRGLAYYTGLVFEVFDKGHAMRAIAGGGRYDKLISTLSDGRLDVPATGFAMGDTVIAHLISSCPAAKKQLDEAMTPHTCTVYMALAAPEMRPQMLLLASTLRDAGVSVDMPLSSSKLNKQLRQAERIGARYTAVIGTEFPTIQLKDMTAHTSLSLSLEQVICELIPHNKDGEKKRQ